jgi:hypothetical protein
MQPSRLIVRSGLYVPTFATKRLHASPRESTRRRKVELLERNVREFCLNVDIHVTSRDLLHATTWDQRLYFPFEGRRAEDFFALIIRRLLPGANPRTWVTKASTLHLDHRSRLILYVKNRRIFAAVATLKFAITSTEYLLNLPFCEQFLSQSVYGFNIRYGVKEEAGTRTDSQ